MKKIIIFLSLLSLILPNIQVRSAAAQIKTDAHGRPIWNEDLTGKTFLDELRSKSSRIAERIRQREELKEFQRNSWLSRDKIYGYVVDMRNDRLINDLYVAIMTGKIQEARRIIQKIKENKVDINTKSGNRGLTPLYIATIEDRPEVVLELLRSGADTSISDSQGRPFLDYAFEKDANGNLKRPRIAKVITEYKRALAR